MAGIEISNYSSLEDVDISELVELFLEIDRDAVGNTYSTSTADMSREMFFEKSESVSDREALTRFSEEYANEIVVARYSGDLIGFTFIWEGEPYFEELLPEYKPLLAITFSGVHPDWQGEGVWSDIREYILENIVPDRDVDYLVTGAAKENEVSVSANKSRGFEVVGQTGDVEGDDETLLLAKKVSVERD